MVAAQEMNLQDILEGTKQYIVPLYQRPYQWGKQQLEALWNDIVELTEDRADGARSSHFIGSLVLAPPPAAVAGGVATHLVVDGQQRLTTLTLLLAAIRDHRDEVEPEDHAGEEIQNRFLVNSYKKGAQHIKLVPTQADRAAYQAVINRFPDSGGSDSIGEAYRFFRTKLAHIDDPDDPDDMAAIQEAVVEGLSLVSISTHPEDNAHRIFQSLNNTGLKLTQGDLLRNYIFMRLPESGDDAYDRYWKPLQARLENDQIESLFWVDIASSKPLAKMSDTFVLQQRRMDALTGEEAILEELARFTKLAELYELILNPQLEKDQSVRHRLQRLRDWYVNTTHPILLNLLAKRDDGSISSKELASTILVLEAFIIRRFLTGRPTQGLNRTFREAAGIFEGVDDTAEHLQRWLSTGRKHYAGDDQLREAIKEQPYYLNGKQAHRPLFLRWLEEEFDSREPIDTTSLSIEHVMPQTLSPEWKQTLKERHPDQSLEDLHSAKKHVLGNLTLTGYNSKLSNRGFDWKREEMSRSGLRLSAGVVENDSWGPDEIDARADALADLICAAWPGPVTTETETTSSEPVVVQDPRWQKLREVLLAIPSGRWTSFGEVGTIVGAGARRVVNYLSEEKVPNAHRVLYRSGEASDSLQWHDQQETRSLQEVLKLEGVEFSSRGKAVDKQFISAEELSALLDPEIETAILVD